MVGNIVMYLMVVFGLPLATLAVLRGVRWWRAAVQRRRIPAPPTPPIERLAADLRRVRRDLTELAPDAPVVRRRATGQAYDSLLAQTCGALGIENRLDSATGTDAEIERLRVEEALHDAGVPVS